MEQGYFKSFDGNEIYLYAWTNVKKPKGIVQIFHGMTEHAGRYDEFAQFLNKNGYLVFADDHRAHGKTVGDVNKVGKYDLTSNLFYDTLFDELYISKLLTEEYNLPIFIFGHSYGSFIAQAYIEKSNYHKKAIMCASALMKDRFQTKILKKIAKLTARNKGSDAPAKLVHKLTFGSYDKKFKSGSWLNTDKEGADNYLNDEYCGNVLSAKFYIDFFTTFEWIYTRPHTKKISKEKPIYLIAGKEDVVGNKGKYMQDLYKFYIGLDIKNVKMNLYPETRHDILHEPIKEKVFNDILAFIEED